MALASVLSAFSLSLLFLQSLASSSSISCFLCVLTRPITFPRLSRIAPPQILPPSPSLHRFVCPSHIPIPSTLALDLPSLLLSQPSFLIHHIIYSFVFFVDFSSLPPPSSSLSSMRFMPRSPTRISRFSTLDTFLFSHGRRRHGGRRPY